MKRVLIIWPLGTPFYFSDFWRSLLVYEVAAHVRKHGFEVDVFDGSEHKTFSELFELILANNYDAIILSAPLDTMDGFSKTLKYIRMLDANMPIYVYGLSTLLSPKTFSALDIQGYSNSGHFEKGILSFLGARDIPANCVLKKYGTWKEYIREKDTVTDWSFMDIADAIKFTVLRISVSRGCQGGCNFCSCAILHGNHDIRKPVKDVCDYIAELEQSGYVGIIEFASPTFTIYKDWVKDFCVEYKKRNLKIRWRCVTRVDQIDTDTVKLMAEANCIRIGLGIETMAEEEQEALHKKIQTERIVQAIKLLQRYHIEVLAYLISGIEKQTCKNLAYTYKTLKELGTIPRITALLRYSSLTFDDMIDTSIASDMCTSSLNKVLGLDNYDLLKLIIGTADLDEKYYK